MSSGQHRSTITITQIAVNFDIHTYSHRSDKGHFRQRLVTHLANQCGHLRSCVSQLYLQMLSFMLWFSFCVGSQIPLISTEDSSPFIFNSLLGVLKQWPNTLHPNGHAIIPVTISPYTLLYHARTDTQNPPPSPEWFGFVPELGYGLVQMAPSGQPTYMHTYRSTRSLRTLAFDGLSAFPTELDVGWMDNLATFVHGAGQRGTGKDRPARGGLAEEYERAIKLCEWANTRNIEGFIRMNSGL